MADSDVDTSGLSVASRIRMYQNNAEGRRSPQRFAVQSSQGRSSSPKKLSPQSSPDAQKKLPSRSPVFPSKVCQPQTNKPLQAAPLPRPSPRPKDVKNDVAPNDMVHMNMKSSHVENDRVKPSKPPLPNKPQFMMKSNVTNDVSHNCREQPTISGMNSNSELVEEPAVAKLSSEKLMDCRRLSQEENNSWKRISGPPSRPLPPPPMSQQDGASEIGDRDTQKELVPSKRQRARSKDAVYEVVELEEAVGFQNEADENDAEYEDPNQSFAPKAEKLQGKGRKILSRISTSRRPPPIPISNADVEKKSPNPPPLPSRNVVVPTAEEQALYSYASDSVDAFQKSLHTTPVMQDSSYEIPDVESVRGLMLGLQNKDSTYETPDTVCVNHFMESVCNAGPDSTDDYEDPTEGADSDSDSDAYCDPESLPVSPQHRIAPKLPAAPQKSLPPPPSDEESDAGDSGDDSGHDYEDPLEEMRPSAKMLSLRRGSQPVLNPDAYLALQDMDLNSTYQDPAEAFSSNHTPFQALPPTPEEAIYEGLENEPLYQVYAADVLSEMRRKSEKSYIGDEDIFSEYSTGGIESGQRILWCHLPSVRSSGVLENLEPRERKRQEAMFEVLTSEASYLKSLNILVNHFMNECLEKVDHVQEEKVLDKQQFHFLFGGLPKIKSVSERFLQSLRGRQEESFIISSISDLVHDYASTQFECYVKYCSNQVYQERTLTRLVSESQAFSDFLGKLESSPRSQGLSLQSFLMLPMQRITRLPLLMDAICRHCEPGSEEFSKTDKALSAIHQVVKACNEGARKMERIEEMYFIQQMLTFKIKPIPIVSSSRWLLRRGEMTCLEGERKMRGLKTLLRGGKYYRIYLFLFNDLLLVTKMKG